MPREMIWENCGWMSKDYRERLIKDMAKGFPINSGGRVMGKTLKAVFRGDTLHIIYEPKSQNEQDHDKDPSGSKNGGI